MDIFIFFRDSRPKINPKDITIEELKGETVGRLPGTINGTEFIIRNCEVLLGFSYGSLVSTHVVCQRLSAMHYHIPVRIFWIFGKNSSSAPTQVFEECGLESPPPRTWLFGYELVCSTSPPPPPHQGLVWELVCGDLSLYPPRIPSRLHWRRRPPVQTWIRIPSLMATLNYAKHVYIAHTQTRISTPYFCTGQEWKSESVFVSGNVNEPLRSAWTSTLKELLPTSNGSDTLQGTGTGTGTRDGQHTKQWFYVPVPCSLYSVYST